MIEEPNCSKRQCKWLQGVIQPDGTEQSEVSYCPAFPDGIPDNIAYGDNKHLSIIKDQEGEKVYEKEKSNVK